MHVFYCISLISKQLIRRNTYSISAQQTRDAFPLTFYMWCHIYYVLNMILNLHIVQVIILSLEHQYTPQNVNTNTYTVILIQLFLISIRNCPFLLKSRNASINHCSMWCYCLVNLLLTFIITYLLFLLLLLFTLLFYAASITWTLRNPNDVPSTT